MRIFILLFMLAPLFLWGQYPDNPRKLRLGFQTTGAGLTYIKDGAPAHTPGDDEDAWMVLDTANNVLYYWDETAGAWENILDDITQDTVFQITNVPDTTTLAPMQGDAFINASADTLGLYDGGQWRLFFGGGGAGSGTVTSVALSLPGEFAVSGSPVTTSGTLSGTWNTQAANTVLAGPASGVDAAPTFRSLVAADITAGGGALGTGSAGQVAYWSGTNTLTGSANMTYSSPLLTLGGTGASLLLTPTSAPVNAAGKWYTSSGNYPHFMNGTTDWPLVRGSAESFTPGSMLFAGTSGQAQQDNANFFWDDTNNRLGIGTTSPDGQIAAQSGDYQWVVSTNATVSSITGNQFGSVNANGSSISGRHTFFLGDASIFRSAGGVFIGDIGSEKLPSAKLNVRSGSGTLLFLAEDASNNPVLAATRSDRRVGIGTSSPQRTAHIAGDARITDLTTDTPTRIVGADVDGDLGEMTAGTGISFAGGQVSATFDISDVGVNLAADDVPVWDGAEFQPSGITSDGSIITVPADEIYLDAASVANISSTGTLRVESSDVMTLAGIGDDFGVELDPSVPQIIIGDVSGTYSGNRLEIVPGFGAFLVGVDDVFLGDALNDDIGTSIVIGEGDIVLGAQDASNPPNLTLSEMYIGATEGEARFFKTKITVPQMELTTLTGTGLVYGVTTTAISKELQQYRLAKGAASFTEATERTYSFSSADTLVVDTFDFTFKPGPIDLVIDSITLQTGGIIRNDKSTTVMWEVDYSFFVDSDEDLCLAFWDLTTDGSEDPEAWSGSITKSLQHDISGTAHPGCSFLVEVPAGQGIRLCLVGNIGVTSEMKVSYLTVTIDEKQR